MGLFSKKPVTFGLAELERVVHDVGMDSTVAKTIRVISSVLALEFTAVKEADAKIAAGNTTAHRLRAEAPVIVAKAKEKAKALRDQAVRVEADGASTARNLEYQASLQEQQVDHYSQLVEHLRT